MFDSAVRRPTFGQWLAGARPHTWPNAFAPVIVGSGAAAQIGGFDLSQAILAGLVSWFLIIGVNYANDYSDGIRGTDEQRQGPQRLVGSGVAQPQQVKLAAFIAFGLASFFGIWLSLASSPWLIGVGALCILAAWFYTGGATPYGYRGLGEISIFIFFGLVAVLGTQFSQAGHVSWIGVLCAISIGVLSASVNLVNNLRDIPTDSVAKKITLAVKLGDPKTRMLYLGAVTVPLVSSLSLAFATSWALIGWLVAPLLWQASAPVRRGAIGPALIPVLGTTGKAMLVWAVVTGVALYL